MAKQFRIGDQVFNAEQPKKAPNKPVVKKAVLRRPDLADQEVSVTKEQMDGVD